MTDRWTPPAKPIARPSTAAVRHDLGPRHGTKGIGEHDGWITDGFVAVRTAAPPANRERVPFPEIADLLRTIPGKAVSAVERTAVIYDPDPTRKAGPMFGGTRKKPRQGVAVRFVDGTMAVYSKARVDYVASHCPRAELAGARAEAMQFRIGGKLCGLVMPFFYRANSALSDVIKRALASQSPVDVSSAKKPDRDQEEEHTMTPEDMIDDEEDIPVAPKPKRAAAKRRKGKASDKARTPRASKAKTESKTKTRKAAAKSDTPKRPRRKVNHAAPKPGSKFTATYKGRKHTMTVKKAKDGGVVYVVKGKEYPSPTAAAMSVITAGRTNGWLFWGIDSRNGSAPAPAPTKAKAKAKGKTKTRAKAKA